MEATRIMRPVSSVFATNYPGRWGNKWLSSPCLCYYERHMVGRWRCQRFTRSACSLV